MMPEGSLPPPLPNSAHVIVFGYGSLLWKHSELECSHSSPAMLRGFVRRLHQWSPDHRGTAASPGRVATLSRSARAAAAGSSGMG